MVLSIFMGLLISIKMDDLHETPSSPPPPFLLPRLARKPRHTLLLEKVYFGSGNTAVSITFVMGKSRGERSLEITEGNINEHLECEVFLPLESLARSSARARSKQCHRTRVDGAL
jgi:hypothetical protein